MVRRNDTLAETIQGPAVFYSRTLDRKYRIIELYTVGHIRSHSLRWRYGAQRCGKCEFEFEFTPSAAAN